MKFRGLLVAALLLAALAGGLYWSNKHPKDDTAKAAKDAPPKILSLSEADIKKIDLKHKDGDTMTLERGELNKWKMTSPQAYLVDQDVASGVVSSAANVSSDKLVLDKAAASDLKQFGLDAPPLEVDITLKDGKVRKLLIGDEAPGSNGVYVKTDGDPRVFTVATYTKGGIDKPVKDLRDKRLLTFEQEKASRVELTAGKQPIEFGRSKDEWQILKPAPMRADGLQVEELIRKLKDAKMDLSISDEDAKKAAAAFASGTPVATARVTDAAGTQELQVRKKGEDYYAKASTVPGVSKVTAELGQGLTKSLEDFRNKKLFDFGFADPSKIEMHDGAKSYSFAKTDDKWRSNGKEMDNTSVQSFLDKLRELSASKFVDSGFGTSSIDLTVTSMDGKRVEKVLISKQGNDWIAKRENEPALYQLDAKTVDELQKAAGDVKPAPPKK